MVDKWHHAFVKTYWNSKHKEWTLMYKKLKIFRRMRDPGMKCELWQSNLTVLQMYAITFLKGLWESCRSGTLEMSGVCKAKGKRNCIKHCILVDKIASHGSTG